MQHSKQILTELMEMAPVLAAAQKVNTYKVPSNYFENFTANLLPIINGEHIDVFSGVQHQMGTVPQGYFENLPNDILSRIKAQNETYEVLEKIGNRNVYTAPQNYFKTLPTEVVSKVGSGAKLVDITKRSSWFKYAAAASVALVLLFGVYKFTNDDKQIDTITEQGIAIANNNKFDEELTKVSEEDIIQYLEKDVSDATISLVANAIDEKELPSQEDYLLDEKALDNFLNANEIQSANN
jgi:hypothetical protein